MEKSNFTWFNNTMLKFKNIDGRILIFLALVLYYAIFFTSRFVFHINLMKLQGISVTSPPFADLTGITSAQDSIRDGYDPMINNPYNPWGRPFNYPRIWQLLRYLNISKSHSIIIGVFLAITFYLSAITLLIPRTDSHGTKLWTLLMLSPAVTLAIERGNNDLVAFILFCLALLGFKIKNKLSNIISYLMILFAAFLKLFPVLAFCSLFKERKKIFWILLLLFSFSFLLYLIYIHEDLKLISQATPMGSRYAYGNKVIFDYIHRYILNKMLDIQAFPYKTLFVWTTTISFVIITFVWSGTCNPKLYSDRSQITSFRIGASIYVGTFFLGNNWDYRLIFLLFTIPQLIQWENEKQKTLASKTLWLILISLWSITWLRIVKLPYYLSTIIDESFNWILFGSLLYLILISLPDWFKDIVYCRHQCRTDLINKQL